MSGNGGSTSHRDENVAHTKRKQIEEEILAAYARAGRWCIQRRSPRSKRWMIAGGMSDKSAAWDTGRAMARNGIEARVISPGGVIVNFLVTRTDAEVAR